MLPPFLYTQPQHQLPYGTVYSNDQTNNDLFGFDLSSEEPVLLHRKAELEQQVRQSLIYIWKSDVSVSEISLIGESLSSASEKEEEKDEETIAISPLHSLTRVIMWSPWLPPTAPSWARSRQKSTAPCCGDETSYWSGSRPFKREGRR